MKELHILLEDYVYEFYKKVVRKQRGVHRNVLLKMRCLNWPGNCLFLHLTPKMRREKIISLYN